MAVVRNITKDELQLGHLGDPPVRAGKEVEVPDEDFVDRAWPKSTWAVVKKPGKGYTDASVDDAFVFVSSAPAEDVPADEEKV